ncbi:hypothetical protein VaNZ11_001541, partial [Volvox africanus]
MQRWTVDAASLVSLALVVAATAALPPAVAVSLACCELAFAASAAVRFSVHSSPGTVKTDRKRRAPSISLPLFGRLGKEVSDGASVFDSGPRETANTGCTPAEQVADKLFDEKEGHLDLLQGGHLLAQWFNGLAGPHQLHVSHVVQLLSYLLLPHPAQAVAVAAAATSSGHNIPTSATLSSIAAPCPRIRTWASRLMELVHHHPKHPDPQVQPQPSNYAAKDVVAAEAKLLACTADPLVASYRPLIFYLLTEAVAAATHLALLLMGFRATMTPGGTATVYTWARGADAAAASASKGAMKKTGGGAMDTAVAAATAATGDGGDPPLVFLHGIGLGLTPYLRLLSRLVTSSGGRRPVYAVQYKHVSMRLTSTIPAPHEVANDVAAFLASRGVTRMSLLAHSYGTLIASALTKLATASPSAPKISRLTLVDPVCFAMFLPHLVRNAIYQQPLQDQQDQEQGSRFSRRSLLRSLIKGLVVAEFHCSVALRRRLDWARVNLWPSELPAQSTVVLSGRDNLVPVREIRRILANRAELLGPACPHPNVLFREDLGHGGFLADEDCQAHVIAASLDVSLQRAKEVIKKNGSAQQIQQEEQRRVTTGARALPRAPLIHDRAAPLPGHQLVPLPSFADRYVLAAEPTIEAVEAVWSQPLGAYF